MSVETTGEAPIFLVSIDLAETSPTESGLIVDNSLIALSTNVEVHGDGKLGINVAWAGGGNDSLWAGLNLSGTAAADKSWFAADWWGFPLQSPDIRLDLDLDQRALSGSSSSQPLPVSFQAFGARDGEYSGTLSLWSPELNQQGWATPFVPLFQASVHDGHVMSVQPAPRRVTLVSLAPTGGGATSSVSAASARSS
jgi:hypothetical protein